MANMKERKGAMKKKGKHEKARFFTSADFGNDSKLQTALGGKATQLSTCLSRLLIAQMQSDFRCCHGGTVSHALQNIYSIIPEKGTPPAPNIF